MTVDEIRQSIKHIKMVRRTDPDYASELEDALRLKVAIFIEKSRATPMWRQVLNDELTSLD